MAIIGSPPTLDLEVCAVTRTAANGLTSSIPGGTTRVSKCGRVESNRPNPNDVKQGGPQWQI
jgi:hypothetical protein